MQMTSSGEGPNGRSDGRRGNAVWEKITHRTRWGQCLSRVRRRQVHRGGRRDTIDLGPLAGIQLLNGLAESGDGEFFGGDIHPNP